MMARWLVALLLPATAHAWAVGARCGRASTVAMCVGADDIVRLGDVETQLRKELKLSGDDSAGAAIVSVHEASVRPNVRKIYAPADACPAEERRAAIEQLSRGLDALEEQVRERRTAARERRRGMACAIALSTAHLLAQLRPAR